MSGENGRDFRKKENIVRYVKHTEARGRGGVRITSGITGIAAPAASGGGVMPEVFCAADI